MERHDVLCGCGWGLLAVPVSEIPDHCPVCGHNFGQDPQEDM